MDEIKTVCGEQTVSQTGMITFLDTEIVRTEEYEQFRRIAECFRRNHIDFQYRMEETGIRTWHVFVRKKEYEEAEYVLHLDHIL